MLVSQRTADELLQREGKEQLARDNQLRMALQVVKSLPKMREIRN